MGWRQQPKATFDKPTNTEKWRVMFTIANSCLVSSREEAEAVADLINLAYDRGKTDVQRDLRELLGAAKEESDV